jgi:uncharacterized protein YjbI with pentapeptide repeats
MTAANPFLCKVQIKYLAPRSPDAWSPEYDPNAQGIATFDVYAAGPVTGSACRTLWRPAGKVSTVPPLEDHLWAGAKYVGVDCQPPKPNVVGFGNALFFSSDKESAATIALQLGNPTRFDIPANPPAPTPSGFLVQELGVWDYAWDGPQGPKSATLLGWHDTFGVYWVSVAVLVPAELSIVSAGIWYLREYANWAWSLDGRVGPNDLTGVDIGGEDYSGMKGDPPQPLTLSEPQFIHARAAHTNFERALFFQAVFESTDLTGARFAGAVLENSRFADCRAEGSSFRQATLVGAQIEHCKFNGADFIEATLAGAHFKDCEFKEARFTGAILAGAIFENCQFDHAALNGADLAGFSLGSDGVGPARFEHCSFQQASLSGADLRGAKFLDCDLRGATLEKPAIYAAFPDPPTDFTGSKIDLSFLGASWTNKILTGVSLTPSPGVVSQLNARHAVLIDMQLASFDLSNADFTHAVMRRVELSKANLQDAKFDMADLRECNLSGSNLESASFTGASLQGDADYAAAVLSGATLMDANFDDANLSGVDLSYSWFWDVSVAGATLVRADFTNAYCAKVEFTDVAQKAFTGVNFSGACLVNASFKGARCGSLDGERTNFSGACLLGADFTAAQLGNADLSAAAVAQEPGTLTATVKQGWPPQDIPIPLPYEPTKGFKEATSEKSICPDRSKGPCDSAKLGSGNVPTTWSNAT